MWLLEPGVEGAAAGHEPQVLGWVLIDLHLMCMCLMCAMQAAQLSWVLVECQLGPLACLMVMLNAAATAVIVLVSAV